MLDLGMQLDALRHALSGLADFEGGLFALTAVLILWMTQHDWASPVPLRRH
jgi:hypothetical protein